MICVCVFFSLSELRLKQKTNPAIVLYSLIATSTLRRVIYISFKIFGFLFHERNGPTFLLNATYHRLELYNLCYFLGNLLSTRSLCGTCLLSNVIFKENDKNQYLDDVFDKVKAYELRNKYNFFC